MKKLTYIISTIIVGISMSSCIGDLNVVQPSEYTSLNVWQESTMMSEIYGAYTTFRSATASNMAFWGEYRSGLYDQGLIDDTSIMHLKDNIIMKSNIVNYLYVFRLFIIIWIEQQLKNIT